MTMNSNSASEHVVAVIETHVEDDDKYDMLNHMPEKLIEIAAAGYKDRSKRRLSLPTSGSRKSSIVSEDGSYKTEKESEKTKRRNSVRRESNISCSSWSESYTEYDSDDAANDPPRSKNQKATNGFSDFCVRNIESWKFGRHEIEFAENEMSGLMKLRNKVGKISNFSNLFYIVSHRNFISIK